MMEYHLNHKKIEYNAEGEKTVGTETVLLRESIDISKGLPWGNDGFTTQKLYDETVYLNFKNETSDLLLSFWQKAGLPVSENFSLDQYHTLVSSQAQHLAAVEKTKLISTAHFPHSIALIEQRISEICETNLIAKNPFDQQSVFHFRVVRPNSHDNNPLHRDVWLEDYANCINLYIPVTGSNADSSLAIIRGSHHWPENKIERTAEGALIDGVKFNVPAVTDIKVDYQIERPDPKENEVLIFSPYLIHGGAANLNGHQTRISIELRLWKKN